MPCDCVSKFGFDGCVSILIPAWSLDLNALMVVGRRRYKEDSITTACKTAPEWIYLPAQAQLWCFYFWYSINIFGEGQSLPGCVVGGIGSAVVEYWLTWPAAVAHRAARTASQIAIAPRLRGESKEAHNERVRIAKEASWKANQSLADAEEALWQDQCDRAADERAKMENDKSHDELVQRLHCDLEEQDAALAAYVTEQDDRQIAEQKSYVCYS